MLFAETDNYYFIQDTLIELLLKKYPVYQVKQEFISSFEKYKKVKDFYNLFTVPVFATDIIIMPSSVIEINNHTPQVLLKEFLKTKFYKKLMARAPMQWLFYPVVLN